MSAKWIRSKKWDDAHLTGWLLPVKVLLRMFSSIPTAVVLLSLVAFYGVLASVPIGLIALVPTWIIYAATAVGTVAVLSAVPVWMLARGLRAAAVGVGARFAIVFLVSILATIAAAALWVMFVWPVVKYDATTGSGFRMFGSFVDKYQSVQFRRLPMMEMSELEFYAWWPLRVVLGLFVLNMVTTTLRRIEFRFPYIGVLTVHTGIVVIALGSIYYSSQKQEGDMILLAGEPDEAGKPSPGAPETGFYDNTRPALWVTQRPEQGWEQRPLRGVPRYNDYNLNALGLKNLPPMARGDTEDHGPISVPVVDGPGSSGAAADQTAVDPDVKFKVVGYASFADLISQYVPEDEAHTGRPGTALRTVEAYLALAPDPNDPGSSDPSKPRKTWRLMPDSPAQRVDLLNVGGTDLLGIEYTRGDTGGRGMTEQRWQDLAASLPRGTEHALIVRHKASGFAGAFPVKEGQRVAVGTSGYWIEVTKLAADPPFPIITRGYQGARSSVAVVHVTPPQVDAGGTAKPAYERWVYSRFPEINQDLVDAPANELKPATEPPMSRRRAADPDLDIVFVDASILQIYFDERPDGTVRALVRLPKGSATVTPSVKLGDSVEVAPGLSLKLAERMDNAVKVEYPFSAPSASRDTKSIGNHQRAALAVEVSVPPSSSAAAAWKTIVWLPFTQYARTQTSEAERVVTIPDGRRVRLMFGRVRHEFWPPMGVRLADFEMTPYDHSTTPRDFSSELIVMRRWANKFEDVRAKTSLNEPLLERTPFEPRKDVPGLVNLVGRLLSVIAPNQYKFSQAGWDQGGWTESAAAAERGEIKRPFARFTILGVGNNPGIYIIATGAVMMSVGIPWAFYVKPWLVRRKKRKIQGQIARGEYVGKRPVGVPAAALSDKEGGRNGHASVSANAAAHASSDLADAPRERSESGSESDGAT